MMLDPGLRKVASALYCYLNTPRALSCEILLRAGEWDQLAAMAVDPTNYLEGCVGAEKFRRDTQAGDFLRKSPLLPVVLDRKALARETFWESEKQCYETNAFLDLLRFPSIRESAAEERFRRILRKARKICGRILGPLPVDIEGAFGPGTSFELKGQAFSTLADKMWITPQCTPECSVVFEHLFWRTHWGRRRLELGLPLPAQCRGNRFTTVPKDATKDRGICIEPLGNLYCQLGIGKFIKRRLAKVGLKVDRSNRPDDPIQLLSFSPPSDGQTIHRIRACEGSIDGSWATIDLSNASDTVATELVRWVIPDDWFKLLCACRSPFTLVEKQWVLLDKFSSMGNGFTFELETLIFAAILAAGLDLKVGDDLLVYGDDILLPQAKAVDALALLRMAGFTPNKRKSFISGPFRESCGGDFFSGQPVRAYFAKGKFESPLEWISCHNELLRRWPGASLALKRCIEQVPLKLRAFGPRFIAGVFWGVPQRTWTEDGITWCNTVVPIPMVLPLERWGSEFTLTLALLGVPSVGIIPRGPPKGYRITRTSIS